MSDFSDAVRESEKLLRSGEIAAARAVLFARVHEKSEDIPALIRLREMQFGDLLPSLQPRDSARPVVLLEGGWPFDGRGGVRQSSGHRPASAKLSLAAVGSLALLPFGGAKTKRRRLESLLNRLPRWGFLHRQLGALARKQGWAEIAILAAWVPWAWRPDSADRLYELAETCLAFQRVAQAMAAARLALERNPRLTRAKVLLRRAGVQAAMVKKPDLPPREDPLV